MLSGLISSIFGGITYGLILSLMAAGLSLIYGIMKNVNTSHGAFYLIGGFLAYLFYALHLPPIINFILVVLSAFFIGIGALYLVIPKKLWVTLDPDEQNIVMIAFLALATVTEYIVLLIFGGASVSIPSIFYGNVKILGNVYLTAQVTFSSYLSLAVFILLYLFLYKSKFGKGIRAYSQNRELALAVGINEFTIVIFTFGLGVSLAALSGSLLGSIFSINSASGWDELVIAFVIVTFGGIGNVFGSLIGGLVYGLVYSIVLYYYPSYAFVAVLLIIYLILLIKPSGILGKVYERV